MQFGNVAVRAYTIEHLVTLSDLYHIAIGAEMFEDLCFPFEVYYFDPSRQACVIRSNLQWLSAMQQFMTDRLATKKLSTLHFCHVFDI